MSVWLRLAPIGLLAILVVASWWSRPSSAEHNQHTLEALPKFPEAVQTAVESGPVYGVEGPYGKRKVGSYLTASYGTRLGTTANQVIDFYVAGLEDKWCTKFVGSSDGPMVYFQRGLTAVTVAAKANQRTFVIGVGPINVQDPEIDNCDR